jgi:hypothetical protein
MIIYYFICPALKHHQSTKSIEDLPNCPDLERQDSHHDSQLDRVDYVVIGFVSVESALPLVVLSQDLLVLPAGLLYLHQKLTNPPG